MAHARQKIAHLQSHTGQLFSGTHCEACYSIPPVIESQHSLHGKPLRLTLDVLPGSRAPSHVVCTGFEDFAAQPFPAASAAQQRSSWSHLSPERQHPMAAAQKLSRDSASSQFGQMPPGFDDSPPPGFRHQQPADARATVCIPNQYDPAPDAFGAATAANTEKSWRSATASQPNSVTAVKQTLRSGIKVTSSGSLLPPSSASALAPVSILRSGIKVSTTGSQGPASSSPAVDMAQQNPSLFTPSGSAQMRGRQLASPEEPCSPVSSTSTHAVGKRQLLEQYLQGSQQQLPGSYAPEAARPKRPTLAPMGRLGVQALQGALSASGQRSTGARQAAARVGCSYVHGAGNVSSDKCPPGFW